MDWKPNLDKETGPLPDRIIAALRRDVAGGVLAAGTRLPPQRDLAYAIGVSLGVVSKAYAEAARRGLVSGEVGRGTYVLAPPTASTHFTLALGPAEGRVDLARNEPPLAPSQTRLGAALKAIGDRSDLSGFADYPPPTGREEHRALASQWLASINGHELGPDRLALTLGAQHAIHITLQVLLAPGETLLTEAGTFHGVRLAATQAGLKLHGLEMDREGVTPESLDRAAASGAGRVVYLIPTLHNPTGRSLSAARRAEIAQVARHRDLILIEDDIYAAHAGGKLGGAPKPLAAYCPERVFYINGTAKALSPGLRLGFLHAPDQAASDAVARALRAHVFSPPVWGAAIFQHWVESGEAVEIANEVRAVARRRLAVALELLGNHAERPAEPCSLHLWLPMSEINAERTNARALRAGVEPTPPTAPIVDASLLSGLRLCLGQAPEERFEAAIRAVASALPGAPDPALQAVI